MSLHFRNLIIIQGDEQQIVYHLDVMTKHIKGDWVTISPDQSFVYCAEYLLPPEQAKTLLGREFKHAIFDARKGFNLDAFAILAGTLIANSVFILWLPDNFATWLDFDSLRWNEQPNPIAVPNFIAHLNRTIKKQQMDYPNNTFNLSMNQFDDDSGLLNFILENKLINADNLLIDNSYDEQQKLLAQLLLAQDDIILLTAKRGRGKSALAGMFSCHHQCWVTAPNKNAVSTLMKFAKPDLRFFAPDELILQLETSSIRPDWLIIDEAAMIPLPMLGVLLNQSYKVLLTSTLDGYEGTGQGLLLKLFKQYESIKKINNYQLTTPIRWAIRDPLEYFADNLTVANPSCTPLLNDDLHVDVFKTTQQELVDSPNELVEFFSLLKSAHYRTTLIDLRRLLDAQNIELYQAISGQKCIGALITIKEGGLPDELIDLIWQGVRRPKGNLVAQSLVAHAGEKRAAKLNSIRINRIAVDESLRHQGVATTLIKALIVEAKSSQCDFVSVSFAFSPEMYQFWTKLNFTVVHVGSYKEASSGSYATMAVYPISEQGYELCHHMKAKLSRNWYWLKNWINIDLPIMIDNDQQLTQNDKLELYHFATTSYPYQASLAVLSRLVLWIKKNQDSDLVTNCPLLFDLIEHRYSENEVVKRYQLSGKQMLLKLLRKEVAILKINDDIGK